MRYLTLLQRRSPTDDAVVLHKEVMALFGQLGDSPRAQANILFRGVSGGRAVLVSSTVQPEHLPDGSSCQQTDVSISNGDTVRFTVTVNAVARRKDASGRIREHAVKPGVWASTRLSTALESIQVDHTETARIRVAGGTLLLTTLSGVATVGDVTALERLLTVGVGRAKAYGAGLLTVSPA